MKALLLNGLVSAALVASSIALYHQLLVRPALAVGVVDVAAVYRAKEAEFTRILTQAGSDEERQRAHQMARAFAQALPAALDELPRECNCLVLLRTAVAGAPHSLDLTAALRAKVDAR